MSEREQKAIVIAATKKLRRFSNFWIVPSQTGKLAYKVKLDPGPYPIE
jgi:hypothetical protein